MIPPAESVRRRAAWRTFQATLFSLPWVGVGTGTLLVGRDPGTGLQPSWLLLGATLVLAAPEIGAWLAARRRPLMVTAGPLLATLLLSGAGLLVAPGAESAAVAWGRFAKQVVQLDLMLLFVLVPAVFLAGGRPLADLVRPLLAGAVGQAGYGLWQVADFLRPGLLPAAVERVFTSNPAIFAGSDRLYLGNVLQDIPRLRGTMCEPLYLGSFLLLALPLVGIGVRSRRLRIALAAMLAVLLLGTWSRGAWLALLGGGMAGLAVGARLAAPVPWRRLGRAGLVGGAVGGLAVAAALLFHWDAALLPARRLLQTFSTVDWSNLTRFYSMQAAWRAFLLSPILGVGWGQFAFHFPALVDPMGLQAMFTWPVVNNFPLAILCETGLLGAGAWAWAGARLARRVAGAAADVPAAIRTELTLLAVANIALWVQLLTFSQYNLPHIWVGLGLLAGAACRRESAS